MKPNNLIVVDTSAASDCQAYLENIVKDSKDIKKIIHIEQNYFGVYVFALAVHENYELNKKIEIPTHLGTPLTPEVHDTVRDVYYLEGLDVLELGHIPVSYRLIIDDCDWDTHVPLPLAVIKRYLTQKQKSILSNWMNTFKNQNCKIKFVQLLGLC